MKREKEMRVILSRKGFDSANGGIVSPIFEDGTMLSLPIPSKDKEIDSIAYVDLRCGDIDVDKVLHDLGYYSKKQNQDSCAHRFCHLDPDLSRERRKLVPNGWEPAFGQINQAAGYLNNCQVGERDLFLFFGNFRHVELKDGKYRYVRYAKDNGDPYYGREIQAIWGYLQVDQKLTTPEELSKFDWHPHSCKQRIFNEKNNTIYTAMKELSFNSELSGYGLFKYDQKRVLTMPGKTKATWKYEEIYDIGNLLGVQRHNCAKNGEGIYYAGIWQELVLAHADKWAENLF